MKTNEVKAILPSLVGKDVAVIYKGPQSLTIWGRVYKDGTKFAPYVLKSFKTGNRYFIVPSSIEFICELKCKPDEIRY